jgi:hypothetical protein
MGEYMTLEQLRQKSWFKRLQSKGLEDEFIAKFCIHLEGQYCFNATEEQLNQWIDRNNLRVPKADIRRAISMPPDVFRMVNWAKVTNAYCDYLKANRLQVGVDPLFGNNLHWYAACLRVLEPARLMAYPETVRKLKQCITKFRPSCDTEWASEEWDRFVYDYADYHAFVTKPLERLVGVNKPFESVPIHDARA